MSNYLANLMIQHEWGKITFTPSSTWYLALCKTAPTAADTGSTLSECNYTNYVRKSFTGANLAAAVANTIASNGTITFAAPGAAGDTANGWAVCDASSAGNMLRYGVLAPAIVIVANGSAPSIPLGSLTFTSS